MMKPSTEPRAQGMAERCQSCFVIHVSSPKLWITSLAPRPSARLRIASGIAKSAMAKIVKSMPSESRLMPKVWRGRPVWKSRPTRPTARPMKIEMRAFAREPDDMVEADKSAVAMSRKYSVEAEDIRQLHQHRRQERQPR